MPATVEGLFILLVFVMPGFITVRTQQMIVPAIRKSDPLQLSLQSITVSLLYLPLWILFAPRLLAFRGQLIDAATSRSGQTPPLSWTGLGISLLLLLALPVVFGFLWAIASWNDWYGSIVRRGYPRFGIPIPPTGVGETVWDRLWLRSPHQPWLTVFMKDGRIYVGRGVEFSLSPNEKELRLGPDTRLFASDWRLIRDLAAARGQGVWICVREVSSIEVHD